MQYWDTHKYHKCYKCGIKGHIAQDCHKVCIKCHNIHNGPFCFYLLLKYLKDLKGTIKKNSISDAGKLIRDMEVAKKKLIKANLLEVPKQTLSVSHPMEITFKARSATRVEKLEFKIKRINAEIDQIRSNREDESFYNKIFGKKKGFWEWAKAGSREEELWQELETAEVTLKNTRLRGKVNITCNPCLMEESNPVVIYRQKQQEALNKIEEEIKKNKYKIRNAARINLSQKYLNQKIQLAEKLSSAIETLKIEKEDLERSLRYNKKEKEYIQAQLKEQSKEAYLEKKEKYYQKMLNVSAILKQKYQKKVSRFYEIVQDMSGALKEMKKQNKPRIKKRYRGPARAFPLFKSWCY
jgi:hypothetical protein